MYLGFLPSQLAMWEVEWLIELAWQYIAMTRNNLSIIWISLKDKFVISKTLGEEFTIAEGWSLIVFNDIIQSFNVRTYIVDKKLWISELCNRKLSFLTIKSRHVIPIFTESLSASRFAPIIALTSTTTKATTTTTATITTTTSATIVPTTVNSIFSSPGTELEVVLNHFKWMI